MSAKKKNSSAQAVVDRGDLKRLEMEKALFDRCLRQLLAVDAVPATKAYLEKSRNVEEATARTTADRNIPGGKEPSWTLHAEMEARNVLHAACVHGRDEALLEIVKGVSASTAAAAAAGTSKRGRRRPAAAAVSVDVLKVCLNTPDGHGDVALHHAARGGHLECARMLLTNGCNPVACNKKTLYSSMHCAANNNEREMMELLYHYECDPTLATFNGLTAAQLARKKGFLRAAAWLEWAEVDWRHKHPDRGGRHRFKFIECSCSYCAMLRQKGGNRDDPSMAIVGAWRKLDKPGYTERHTLNHSYLVRQAERRALMPDKKTDE